MDFKETLTNVCSVRVCSEKKNMNVELGRGCKRWTNMSLKKVAMPEQDPNVRNKNFEEVALGYNKRDGNGRSSSLLKL